uniref:Uncharacterized protein n=1 Tax=Arundo donax TaxID=35708 RepID=A0A0A9EG52_ARUDO
MQNASANQKILCDTEPRLDCTKFKVKTTLNQNMIKHLQT